MAGWESRRFVVVGRDIENELEKLACGIILLLWLNYSSFALLFGAELNSELDRQADIRAAGGEHAGLTPVVKRGR